MKKVFIAILLFVIIGSIAGIIIASKVKNFEVYMEQIEIQDVDISSINDGTYTGISDAGVIKVKVEVTVNDHIIKSIKLLEHKSGKGKEAERIIDDIVKEQKITVDAISGATLSSRVIQDAVQKAFDDE